MRIKSINKIDYVGDVYNLRIKSEDGLNHNYIANGISVSNCHKARGQSIGDILASCVNWEYKLGLSGTMKIDLEYSDFYTMQERTGPLVMTLSAKFLMDNDYSPDIKIKQVFLEYDMNDPRIAEYVKIQTNKTLRKKVKDQFRDPMEFGKRMLEIEKEIIFDSNERIEFISRITKKFGKNTLILFSDVKNEYGFRIHNAIKEWNPNTFYIDGGVETPDREDAKNVMEEPSAKTILRFADDIEIKVSQFKRVTLTNKKVKLAKDITLDDDVANSWIESNK